MATELEKPKSKSTSRLDLDAIDVLTKLFTVVNGKPNADRISKTVVDKIELLVKKIN